MDGVTEDDILVHDETNKAMAQLLAAMEPPDFPVAIGVLYCNPAESSYEDAVRDQVDAASTGGTPALNDVLRRGNTWSVG